MNEAEFLSNKIAILINGELYCINSLQSLKSTYSEGYKIFVKPSAEKNENCNFFFLNNFLNLIINLK